MMDGFFREGGIFPASINVKRNLHIYLPPCKHSG